MYNRLVQSDIDYGTRFWGGVESFRILTLYNGERLRSFLGVHKKTPNASVLDEVDWIRQVVLQKVCITRQGGRHSKNGRYRIEPSCHRMQRVPPHRENIEDEIHATLKRTFYDGLKGNKKTNA